MYPGSIVTLEVHGNFSMQRLATRHFWRLNELPSQCSGQDLPYSCYLSKAAQRRHSKAADALCSTANFA